MTRIAENDAPTIVGGLTARHAGLRVEADLTSIQGWLPHLLLSSAEQRGDETTLMFRWNDDPSPSNTERGQFACGVTVPSTTPCCVTPPGVTR